MRIILDSNILIAALLRDSIVRKILIESDLYFLLPEVSLDEIRRHEDELVRKSKIAVDEFRAFLERLLQYIEVVPTETLRLREREAKRIMAEIDPGDVPFIAAALAFEDAVVWSDDKHFKRQDAVSVVNTKELLIALEWI